MKGFDQLNKAFESRVRLGLMSILSVNSWISYKEIKDLLEVTDGNLASHIQSLEKIKYLEIKKDTNVMLNKFKKLNFMFFILVC